MPVNQIICNVGGANTGIPDCAFTMKNVVKVFLVPSSFELTEAQLSTPESALAALVTAASADLPSQRIYPTPEIVGVTNNSEDVVTQTLGYGVPVVVRDGKQNIQFQYLRGGNCVSNALRKFNNGNWKVLFLDADGVLVGTKVGETIKGIPLDVFYARPFTMNDGTNVSAYTFQLTFSPAYINEAIGFIQLPLADALAIDGLENINLKLASRAAAVLLVTALSGCSKENLYDQYSAELAEVTNWIVRKQSNGNQVTVTSVALDANTKSFAITQDTTDPYYSATAALTLELAPPSILAANGITGYEGVKLPIPAV